MNKLVMVVIPMAIVGALAAGLVALADEEPVPAAAGQEVEPAGGAPEQGAVVGPRGNGVGGRGGMGGRRAMGMGGGALGFGRGYIEPNAESQKLWEELGTLQSAMHAKQWEIYGIMAQQPMDREKVRAALKEMTQLRRQQNTLRQQLQQYWHALPGAGGEEGQAGQGQGPRAGRGQGRGARGGGGAQLPPPVEQ